MLGEIRKGIEFVRPPDPRKASALRAWLEQLVTGFADRLLSVDTAVAETWGHMNAIRTALAIWLLHLFEVQVQAYRIADNQLVLTSSWDEILSPTVSAIILSWITKPVR